MTNRGIRPGLFRSRCAILPGLGLCCGARLRAHAKNYRNRLEEMMSATPDKTDLLNCVEHWERYTPEAVYLTQPYPGGKVVDYTWREVVDQSRRMASYLQTLGLR